MTTPLFDDDDERGSFPAPIADALDRLVAEISTHGEETTADETAIAIEVTFAHLGRLWIAEYLHAVEGDGSFAHAALNRVLMECASSDRPIATGRWVEIARAVRERFVVRERATVLAALAHVDFGSLTDTGHRVARLVTFRNRFAHGNFRVPQPAISWHRRQLHDLLECLPALRQQPALFVDEATAVARAATGRWPIVPTPSGAPLPSAYPVILGAGGTRLNLHPLLRVVRDSGNWRLAPPEPLRAIFGRAVLAGWLDRYEHERRGFLPFEGKTDASTLPEALLSGSKGVPGLRAALAGSRPGLVLVEAFPGCAGDGAVAALQRDDPCQLGLSRFAAVERVAVRPGALGQSGLVVVRVALRLIEQALGMVPGSITADAVDAITPTGPLARACSELTASGREVLLGIDALHFGRHAYRGELFSVLDVYEFLARTPVSIVATTVPGGLDRPLVDRRIVVPVAASPDLEEVSMSVRELGAEAMRARVLRSLAARPEGFDLFELCDDLERGGASVFEPEVERALWDLRPLLTWQNIKREEERVRVWRLFSPAICATVNAVLGGGV